MHSALSDFAATARRRGLQALPSQCLASGKRICRRAPNFARQNFIILTYIRPSHRCRQRRRRASNTCSGFMEKHTARAPCRHTPQDGPFRWLEQAVLQCGTRRFTLRNGTGPQPVVCQQVAHKPSFGGTPRSSHGSAALQARLSNRFQAARKCKGKIKMACPLRNADKICIFAK